VGPLRSVRIIEIAGLGAAPFAGMIFADLGAEVLLVDSPRGHPYPTDPKLDFMNRGKKRITIDLKSADGLAVLLKLVENADGLMEGFRPGTAERLGIGPAECLARNPKLSYGRMTGWGQHGPLATTAGHDINYIALSGALHMMARKGGKPTAPLNMLGDYAGGGMVLVYGMLSAILDARANGEGQVVDAAMLDGAATIMGPISGGIRGDNILFGPTPGDNVLDSGSHFYDTYETSDGKHVAVGAIEPHFYALLLEGLGLDPRDLPEQMDKVAWPKMKQVFAEVFRTKTRDEWSEIFDGTDACVSPVLSEAEAGEHPHNKARSTFTAIDGVYQHEAAPRFDKTPIAARVGTCAEGTHTKAILSMVGFTAEEIERLMREKSVA